MWCPDDDYLSSAVDQIEEESLRGEEDHETNTEKIFNEVKERTKNQPKVKKPSQEAEPYDNSVEELQQELDKVGINFSEDRSDWYGRDRVYSENTEDGPAIIMSGNIPIFRADRFFEPNRLHPERTNHAIQPHSAIEVEIPTLPILVTVPKPVTPPPGLDRPLPETITSSSSNKKNKKGAKGKKLKFKPAQELWSEATNISIGPDCSNVCTPRQALLYRKFNN